MCTQEHIHFTDPSLEICAFIKLKNCLQAGRLASSLKLLHPDVPGSRSRNVLITKLQYNIHEFIHNDASDERIIVIEVYKQ
jgi:hypothetical protein